jgi:hypothetical protein
MFISPSLTYADSKALQIIFIQVILSNVLIRLCVQSIISEE